MQSRYFIGITLPGELSSRISQVQNELFQLGKTMQPLVPHITLLHPTILEKLPPKYFIPKVKKIAAKHMPAEIKLNELSMFNKRVIYIKAESKAVENLYKELLKLLPESTRAQLGANRKFQPHVTLTQNKPKQKLDPILIQDFKKQIDVLLPQYFQTKLLTKFVWQSPKNYSLKKI